MRVQRSLQNPILSPVFDHVWESDAVFNGCIVKINNAFFMLYRAQGPEKLHQGIPLSLSTIGIAKSSDAIHFNGRKQLIVPTTDWDRYGCEDPRVTFIDGKYYIFYTGISTVPPGADGIKVGLAVSSNLSNIDEKHLITPFNAKAMALFPARIHNQIVVIFTAHTDIPPAKIVIASVDSPAQLWDSHFWEIWEQSLDSHSLTINHPSNDHVEVGAAPIQTEKGWLLIYCRIENYFRGHRVFRIDGLLLDSNNPQKIIAQTKEPYLVPQESYELKGEVPNVIFPSGALIKDDLLYIYYGAADTTCCLATIPVEDALAQLVSI